MKYHDRKQKVLLVSAPGIVREATIAMLESIPQVGSLELASGALSAIEQLQTGSSYMLVIDANIQVEEAESLARLSKQRHPDTRCVVLVKGTGELEQARSAGADAVFLRSSTAQQLTEALWPNERS